MIRWTLPLARPAVAVRVTAGQRGCVIPATRSDLVVDGAGVPHLDARAALPPSPVMQVIPSTPPILAARFPGTLDVLVLLHGLDLLEVLPVGQRCLIVAHVHYLDGSVGQFTRTLYVDAEAPTGTVTAHVTPSGTFLAYNVLSSDVDTLTVTTPTSTATVQVPEGGGEGVVLADTITDAPVSVIATDQSGNESENILLHVTVQPAESERTPLSAWPLTPDLDARKPVIGAFLRAFELTLDLRPDDWGDQLNFNLAEEGSLLEIARHFGKYRRSGETNGDLIRRLQAIPRPGKSTLSGLTFMLRSEGFPGGEVVDEITDGLSNRPLTFDGTWSFDGSKAFDGGNPSGLFTEAGMVVGVFKTPPAFSLRAARTALQRFVAAGIVARTRLQVTVPASFGKSAFTRRIGRTFPIGSRLLFTTNAVPLTFDGTWSFDGSESFDGVRHTDTPITL